MFLCLAFLSLGASSSPWSASTCLPPQSIFRVLFLRPVWVMKERDGEQQNKEKE